MNILSPVSSIEKVKDQILTLQTFGKHKNLIDVLNTDELKVVDFVLTVGKITSNDAVDILHTPKRTAQSKLKRLEKTRILIKKGAGPSTYYILSRK